MSMYHMRSYMGGTEVIFPWSNDMKTSYYSNISHCFRNIYIKTV